MLLHLPQIDPLVQRWQLQGDRLLRQGRRGHNPIDCVRIQLVLLISPLEILCDPTARSLYHGLVLSSTRPFIRPALHRANLLLQANLWIGLLRTWHLLLGRLILLGIPAIITGTCFIRRSVDFHLLLLGTQVSTAHHVICQGEARRFNLDLGIVPQVLTNEVKFNVVWFLGVFVAQLWKYLPHNYKPKLVFTLRALMKSG